MLTFQLLGALAVLVYSYAAVVYAQEDNRNWWIWLIGSSVFYVIMIFAVLFTKALVKFVAL